MTKPSSASVPDASVEAAGISQINIDITLEYVGSPGDYVNLYEPFFDALDGKYLSLLYLSHMADKLCCQVLTRSTFPCKYSSSRTLNRADDINIAAGPSPFVHVHVGTRRQRPTVNHRDDDHGANNDGDTMPSPIPSIISISDSDASDDADMEDNQDTLASESSLSAEPSLSAIAETEPSLGTIPHLEGSQSTQMSLSTVADIPTCPNTPEGYHIIYYCDGHGSQNHYGPHCNCVPTYISINMPPALLPDGSRPPILPDGRILYPPPESTSPSATAEETSTPHSEMLPPDYKEQDTSAVLAATLAHLGLDNPVSSNAAAGPSSAVMSTAPTFATNVANTPTPTPPQATPGGAGVGGPFYAVFVGVQVGVFDDW